MFVIDNRETKLKSNTRIGICLSKSFALRCHNIASGVIVLQSQPINLRNSCVLLLTLSVANVPYCRSSIFISSNKVVYVRQYMFLPATLGNPFRNEGRIYTSFLCVTVNPGRIYASNQYT